MGVVSFTGKCTNRGCPKFDALQSMQLDSLKTPRCGHCAQALTAAAPKPPAVPLSPYDQTKQKVRAEYGKGPMAGYIDKVLAYLDANQKFREDFVSDMKKKVDFTKFAKNKEHVRATDAKSVCVDNALKAVGMPLPAGCPPGEKYTFEVPYIMQNAGWTYMDYSSKVPMLQAPMSEFLERAQTEPAARVYLVVRSEHAGAAESHMIVVYATAAGRNQEAWIHDAQKLTNNYANGYCEVWMSPSGAETKKSPYCPFDLDTARMGDWV